MKTQNANSTTEGILSENAVKEILNDKSRRENISLTRQSTLATTGKRQKHPGGRPQLPPEQKRKQVSITLPPDLLDLYERERSAAPYDMSLAQVVELSLRDRYRNFGWVSK